MNDSAKPKNSRAAIQREQSRPDDARLLRRTCLFTSCVALAAVIVLAIVALSPPEQPEPSESEATPEAAAPPPPTTHRQPTIILASLAVPAAAEQLQKETEQVADDLRSRYPGRAEALHVAAMMHMQFRQSAEAEKLWKQCIALSPKDERYYVNFAAVAMDRGNSKMAAETLQAALELGLSSPDILHHLGVALTNIGRSEEAVEVVKKALADNPRSASHWMVLGQAQLKLSMPAEAEASLKQALELGLQSSSAYAALANACAQQGKQEDAAKYRELLEKATAGQPLDAQERFRVLTAAEARRTAVAILTEAATVHFWQGNSLESERLLLRAIALDPSSVASCRALASLFDEARMSTEEQVVRRRLLEIDPFNLDNYLKLAQASQELGEPESAEAALKLAITVRPDSPVGYSTLARFHLQSGKAKQARWYAQEALRRQPTPEGYVLLASICRLLGDDANAAAAMEEADKLSSKRSVEDLP